MSEHDDPEIRQQTEHRDAAIAEIGDALHAIEQADRHPDQWESHHLATALNLAFHGCYTLATTEARVSRMMRPAGETYQIPSDSIYAKCNLAALRRAWDALRAESVRRFSHLGPIELR